MKSYLLRIEDNVLTSIKYHADKNERSINWVVNKAITEYLTKNGIKVNEQATEPAPTKTPKQDVKTSTAVSTTVLTTKKETIEEQVKRIAQEKLEKRNTMPSKAATLPIQNNDTPIEVEQF